VSLRRHRHLALSAIAGLVASIVLAGCGGSSGSSDTIVLYSGQHPQLTNALIAAFTKKTGIHVSVRVADGLVLADQILQEGSHSPADAYLTENSPELMNLESHHLLAPLPSAILRSIPSNHDSPDGDWVGVALRVSSLAYDPSMVARDRLPASLLDLAQPSWRGRIAIAPTDSDFPPLVGAIIATYGRATAVRWLAGLKRNAQLYQDEEGVVAAVNRGDVAAGVVNQYYWYRLRLELGAGAMHSALYYFPHGNVGSLENVSGAAVLASSTHKAQARQLLAFMVSSAGQRLISAGDDFEYPARPGIPPNPALPPLASLSPTTVNVVALGTDQVAAQLIIAAGLA
jgi:iron(III) transport system substrate-binding protein